MMNASIPLAGEQSAAEISAHGALYKGIGLTLAIASGLFIGSSFVLKKRGLLEAMGQCHAAGEGYGYLRSYMWWMGMTLMVVGECCNFVAYSFTAAILVTPLGALSVVVSAILSSIFLKEHLTFQGKIGCVQCIFGAVIIVMHAPEEGAKDTSIETFKHLMLSAGFLTYAGIATLVSCVLAFYCGPRWGKQNLLVYIGICSWIGSLSVVFTQGLGSAVVHSFTVDNQFTNWFLYLVLCLTAITLMVEIIYLNKALNLFNTAMVTAIYYVAFTTLTIVSSMVLYRGFDASLVNTVTCVFGFMVICSGVALLHHSRSQSPSAQDDGNSMESRKEGLIELFEYERKVYHDSPTEQQSLCAYSPGSSNQLFQDCMQEREPNWNRWSFSTSQPSVISSDSAENVTQDGVMPRTSHRTSTSLATRRAQDMIGVIHAYKLGLRRDIFDEEQKRLVDL